MVEEIRRAFSGHNPERIKNHACDEAAVAMILQQGAVDTEILFIERAKHPRDPWSGQIALPGGRRELQDLDLRAVAERETLEEVGISLRSAEPIGMLSDLEGHRAGQKVGLVISAFVYFHPEAGPLRISDEVANAFWIPISSLWERQRRVSHVYGGLGPYPGIQISKAESHVVWGLTFHFVECFLKVIGKQVIHDPRLCS